MELSHENAYITKLLTETVGIEIDIISNEYHEIPAYEDSKNQYQKIVFQVKEEEPDIWAIGVIFTLSLMSFSFAAPRGYSEIEFIPDEEWNLVYFLDNLEFRWKCLYFSSDYVSGRLMKTDIKFESGGKVTLETRNRGKGAERWLLHLQGNRHIKKV
jgi:hypothetical protein